MINSLFSATPAISSKNVYVYLDDIIIRSKDPESHLATLKAVILKFKEAGLKIKLSKYEFLKSKKLFWGHIVDGHGIHTMDDKILAIERFPQPQNADNVRSFLGLCGYSRPFIKKKIAAMALPSIQLLKKDVPFHWNAAQIKSFQELIVALTNAPVLAFFDYESPFILYTDVSAQGLGAVLMQEDARGKNIAIAYAS